MREPQVFFDRTQSLLWRCAAAVLVMCSHYVHWYGGYIHPEKLQYILTKTGVYGVNIFFLLSGYGLAKSYREKKPGRNYWPDRFFSVYLPYLVVGGCVCAAEGRLDSLHHLWNFLNGSFFWYMQNILLFYLVFWLIFLAVPAKSGRVLGIWLAVLGLCFVQMAMKKADFWYISNIAFAGGVTLALYEDELLLGWKYIRRGRVPAVGSIAMLTIVLILAGAWKASVIENTRLLYVHGYLINLAWMLLIIGLNLLMSSTTETKPPKFAIFCGKMSLELYLIHVFVYTQCAQILGQYSIAPLALLMIALILTFALSAAIYLLRVNLIKQLRKQL